MKRLISQGTVISLCLFALTTVSAQEPDKQPLVARASQAMPMKPETHVPFEEELLGAMPFLWQFQGGTRPQRAWRNPHTRQSRVVTGDFHTPAKKPSFFRPFLRFFLAFSIFLGYSPLRPGFSAGKRG
jgi:hypothetical protein